MKAALATTRNTVFDRLSPMTTSPRKAAQAARSARSLCPGRSPGQKNLPLSASVCVGLRPIPPLPASCLGPTDNSQKPSIGRRPTRTHADRFFMPVDLTGIKLPACGAGFPTPTRSIDSFQACRLLTAVLAQQHPGCAQRAASLPGQVARAKYPALVCVRLRPSAANLIPFCFLPRTPQTTSQKPSIGRRPTRTHADRFFMPVDLTGIKPPACGAEFPLRPGPSIHSSLSPAAAAPAQQHPAARSARRLCPGRSPGQKNPALVRVRLRPSAANPIPFCFLPRAHSDNPKNSIGRRPTRTHADRFFMPVDLTGIKPPACGAVFSTLTRSIDSLQPVACCRCPRATDTWLRAARGALCPGRSPGQKTLPLSASVCVGLRLILFFSCLLPQTHTDHIQEKLSIGRRPTRTHADRFFMPVDLTGIKPPACGAVFLPYPGSSIHARLSLMAYCPTATKTQAARSAPAFARAGRPGKKNYSWCLVLVNGGCCPRPSASVCG